MSSNNDVEMVNDLIEDLFMKNCNNYDEMRDYTLASFTHRSRTLSLSLSNNKENYVTRVQRESDRMVEDDPVASTDSPQCQDDRKWT